MDTEPEIVSTGLAGLTATVTSPEPAAEPVIEPVMVPAVVEAAQPLGWDLHRVMALVTDFAQNMYERDFLLKKHGLTEDQMQVLEANEFYKRAYEAEVIAWNRADSVHRRLALEAAIAVEQAMPTLAARLQSSTAPLADVTSLLKVFAEIAGVVGAKAVNPAAGGGGDKIKITINLGADTVQREASPVVAQVRAQPEGEGQSRAVQAFLEAAGSATPVQGQS